MPSLSVWTIRLAFGYLLVGATVGASLVGARAGALPAALYRHLPAHLEVMVMGWLVQLAMGVGYWMLPRVEGARPRPGLAALAVVLLNAGVVLAAVGGSSAISGLVVWGRVLEVAGALAFGAHTWPRVRSGGLVGRITMGEEGR